MSKSNDLRKSERPEFFEPMMYSKKLSTNVCIKFEDIELTPLQIPVRRKPVLRRQPGYNFPLVSILGKRKRNATFNFAMNDKERYGQEIPPDFFKTNVGHNAFSKDGYIAPTNSPIHSYEAKISYWKEKYQPDLIIKPF